jgi:hypothetical protein
MADTLISTMGLFWRADHVFWGTPKNSGSLLGRPARRRRDDPADFREQIGIYILYADYKLVYVGQTGSGDQKMLFRLRQHRSDDLAGRWNQFSWYGVRRVVAGGLSMPKSAFHPTLATALNHIEGVLIHAAEPPFNGQGGRFGSNVTRFLQVRDARLGLTDRELLHELCDQAGVNTTGHEEDVEDEAG